MPVPAVLAALIPGVMEVIRPFLPEDKTERAKAELEVQRLLMTQSADLERYAADIIKTEAGSEHWYVACWRPTLMYLFIVILGNNFIIAPYAKAFFGVDVVLAPDMNTLPDLFWDIVMMGMGGYIVGRTTEKVVKNWRKR